jgi:ubiquinone/menaquinone biosynthesis C-methylase UbiE
VTQKDIFLQGEGNAWLTRNAEGLGKQEFSAGDTLTAELLDLAKLDKTLPATVKVLEVGCGAGGRLSWIRQQLGWECHGVDPSDKAIELAVASGVDAKVGTADALDYQARTFDIVVFGFCLYLCDRDDLFKIAAEADRVLKNPGWLLIKDFYSASPVARTYHHKAGVYSYKTDYRTLFTWNPDYTVFAHRVTHHESGAYTDDSQEWTATSVLRKCRKP